MKIEDLALQRNKYKHLTDEEWRWFLQQVEGRERTADKLPTFATIEDWWYPVRLSCEQCSSELAARYKASLVESQKSKVESQKSKAKSHFADLTGGYGVDTYFLSEQFEHTDYVEQNAELCRIAEHNFGISQKSKVESQKPSISIHNSTAEEFLTKSQIVNRKSSNRQFDYDLIYIDPARRDSHGGKVFRLEDCTPNVVELLPTLLAHLTPQGRLMLKLSPILDLTQAISHLTPYTLHLSWDIHVVAIKNEVKEVLLLSRKSKDESQKPTITAIDLDKKEQAFVFTREEEREVNFKFQISNFKFIYEPNAAILKAGAYKLVAQRFGLQKLDVNTHLYASDKFIENFPGRVWKIDERQASGAKGQANVLCRNYPLTAEQLKKKLKLKDGGDTFIIGCRVNGKPTLFTAQRLEDIHTES